MNTQNNTQRTTTEWFAYLNALLTQFGKTNRYTFSIAHETYESGEDHVYISIVGNGGKKNIIMDLNMSSEETERTFNETKNTITNFNKNRNR